MYSHISNTGCERGDDCKGTKVLEARPSGEKVDLFENVQEKSQKILASRVKCNFWKMYHHRHIVWWHQECSASHNWNIGTVFRELARLTLWSFNSSHKYAKCSLLSVQKLFSYQGGAKGTKRGSSRVESKRRWTESGLLPRLHLTKLGIIRVEHQFDRSIKSGPVEPSYLMHIWARLAASSASNKIVWLVGIDLVNQRFYRFEQFCCWFNFSHPPTNQ